MFSTFIRILLGLVKLLASLSGILAAIITVKAIFPGEHDLPMIFVGYLFGLIIITLFCSYLIYSGITQVWNKKIRYKGFFWAGLISSALLIVILTVSYIRNISEAELSKQLPPILLILVLSLSDFIRIRKQDA